MKRPIHETLRAAGQGLLLGSAIAIPLVLALVYLNGWQLAIAGPATGAGLITLANALKRRHESGVWRKP